MIWHEFKKDDCSAASELLSVAPENFLAKTLLKDSIFHLHIPKTGGSFLTKVLNSSNIKFYSPSHRKCNPDINLYPDPTDAIPRTGIFQDQPGFSESLRISIIRNPFEWLVSYYFHSHRINFPESTDFLDNSLGVGGIRTIYSSFDTFVEAYCNEEMYWPKGMAEFRRFYPFQIFDSTGECQAHFILKNSMQNDKLTTSLRTSIICLMSAFGYSPHGFPTNIAELLNKKINVSDDKNHDYRSYYSDYQIKKLNKKWKDILEVFEYNFAGSTGEKLIIDGEKLRYSFKENRLWKTNV
jgi:hypothetical protein|tara:strand:+ start:7416 stop:8303 length:888 start_codon:yes stop_codon:yes gene_type:complete